MFLITHLQFVRWSEKYLESSGHTKWLRDSLKHFTSLPWGWETLVWFGKGCSLDLEEASLGIAWSLIFSRALRNPVFSTALEMLWQNKTIKRYPQDTTGCLGRDEGWRMLKACWTKKIKIIKGKTQKRQRSCWTCGLLGRFFMDQLSWQREEISL